MIWPNLFVSFLKINLLHIISTRVIIQAVNGRVLICILQGNYWVGFRWAFGEAIPLQLCSRLGHWYNWYCLSGPSTPSPRSTRFCSYCRISLRTLPASASISHLLLISGNVYFGAREWNINLIEKIYNKIRNRRTEN